MTRHADYYRDLGRRIQRARLELGLTQEALASLVGISRTSMVNIERGRQKVLAHTLVRLARWLKADIKDLARDSANDLEIDDLLNKVSEPTKQFVRAAIAKAVKEK